MSSASFSRHLEAAGWSPSNLCVSASLLFHPGCRTKLRTEQRAQTRTHRQRAFSETQEGIRGGREAARGRRPPGQRGRDSRGRRAARAAHRIWRQSESEAWLCFLSRFFSFCFCTWRRRRGLDRVCPPERAGRREPSGVQGSVSSGSRDGAGGAGELPSRFLLPAARLSGRAGLSSLGRAGQRAGARAGSFVGCWGTHERVARVTVGQQIFCVL